MINMFYMRIFLHFLLLFTAKSFKLFYYLFERQKEKPSFPYADHFSTGHNIQFWSRLKPEGWSSILAPQRGSKSPEFFSAAFRGTLSKEWIKSRVSGTWTSTWLWGVSIAKRGLMCYTTRLVPMAKFWVVSFPRNLDNIMESRGLRC